MLVGEDDSFHLGAPLYLTDEVMIRLCAIVDLQTGTTDGPYVIVSSDDSDDEWTLERTRGIGKALLAFVETAQATLDLSNGASNARTQQQGHNAQEDKTRRATRATRRRKAGRNGGRPL